MFFAVLRFSPARDAYAVSCVSGVWFQHGTYLYHHQPIAVHCWTQASSHTGGVLPLITTLGRRAGDRCVRFWTMLSSREALLPTSWISP